MTSAVINTLASLSNVEDANGCALQATSTKKHAGMNFIRGQLPLIEHGDKSLGNIFAVTPG